MLAIDRGKGDVVPNNKGLSSIEARSRSLLQAYKSASDAYLLFESSKSPLQLAFVAQILCGAYGELQGDTVFWGNLADLLPQIEKHRAELEQVGSDIKRFHAFELSVLTQDGRLDSATAERLISNVQSALQLVASGGGGAAFVQAQNAVAALRAEICKYTAKVGLGRGVGGKLVLPPKKSAPKPPQKSVLQRDVLMVRRGIWGLAGASLVLPNVAAIKTHPIQALESVGQAVATLVVSGPPK